MINNGIFKDRVSQASLQLLMLFLLLSGTAAPLYLIPSILEEKMTGGKIAFIDLNSDPLMGTIKISGTGINGEQHENINSIIWSQVPNAVIDFDAFDKMGLSLNLRVDEDSPYGRVIIGNYGQDKPANIPIPAPGKPIRYVGIETKNVNFADANVTLLYEDADRENIGKNNLTLYILDTQALDWKELTSSIDEKNNTISATVDVMSAFALAMHVPGIPHYIPGGSREKNRILKKEIAAGNSASVNSNITGNLQAKKKHFGIDEIPEFTFEYANETKGKISSLSAEHNKARGTLKIAEGSIRSYVIDPRGEITDIEPELEEISAGKVSIKLPKKSAFRAGVYTLEVEYGKDGILYTREQEFQWGLVSLNTRKSIYKPGENAEFIIVVLDRYGHPVNDADIFLTVSDPGKKTSGYSTANGTITLTDESGVYAANYPTKTQGKHTIDITASVAGTKVFFNTFFQVRQVIEFDILRTARSKIDPTMQNIFDVRLNIGSNTGADSISIQEFVPSLFEISSTNALITTLDDVKTLSWNKTIIENNTSVAYSYSVPHIWPYLYALGPAQIQYSGETFTEARPWYVAVDPAAGANYAGAAGTSSWTGAANAVGSGETTCADSGYSTLTPTNFWKTFGFSIPEGATIDGIKVEFKASRHSDPGNNDMKINVGAGESTPGTEKTQAVTSQACGSGQTLYSLGGTTDKWGRTWTTSEINADTFTVKFTKSSGETQNYLNWVRVTVYYTAVVDTTAPTYSLNQTNSTGAGQSVLFSLFWTDDTALSGYTFSFDNGTGTFSNNSYIAMTGTGNWSNVTKTVNSTVGSTIRWRVYANDTSGNINASSIFSFYTTAVFTISGYVNNQSSGLPLSGANVITNTSLSTTTNNSGFYNFTDLSNGTYLITAIKTGYFNNSTTAVISGLNVSNANISLLPITYVISGYVNDSLSGLGISGVYVTTNTSLNTTTNASGFYNITGLYNGTYLITASSTGYFANSTTKTINASNVSNANITLSPLTYNLSGYVLNSSSGLPLSGVNITKNGSFATTTNASGYYSLVLQNGTYILNSSLNRYTTSSTITTINGLNVTNNNISLSPLVLSGYVVDDFSGAVISGATVQTNTSNTTTSNAIGYYLFTGLPDGDYIINASLNGYLSNSTNTTVNGTDRTNVNISLKQYYLISGYVIDQFYGTGIWGANLTTNTGNSTTSNATGYYNFSLISGNYLINTSYPDHYDSSVTLTVNGSNQTGYNISLRPYPRWGTPVLSKQAMRCSTGVSIGPDTTDSNCGTSYNSMRTALLLDPSGTTNSSITFPAFNGSSMYAFFVNNSVYSPYINVTGINGSISMNRGTSGTAYGKLELGYYDPNGTSDNFVNLFNSTETDAVTIATVASYPVSFSNLSGVIPTGMKLSIRVWMRTNASIQPRFNTFKTTTGYDSSVNLTIAVPDLTISGYVINASSGLPLGDATVITNTSLSTTTNESGYYSFTGLYDGTYLINASLYTYDTNSTTFDVSVLNLSNANISLSPSPRYTVSGYISNYTDGAKLSNVSITTDLGESTTTDASGYYGLELVNGTYTITASKQNYANNAITVTVNGEAITDADMLLEYMEGRILVSTNRYVILDDWTTGSRLGTGFSNPGNTHSSNSWTNINTKINATALHLDFDGFPKNEKNITFNLYMPNGTELTDARVNVTTNSNGLANFSYDMDGENYYGNWTIKASYGEITQNTTFIYNWWGCGTSGCSSHSSRNPSGTATQNSPYLSRRDSTTGAFGSHATVCTNCHQSFDGKTGGNALGSPNHTNNPSDVHRNLTCDNTKCHQTVSSHDTNAVIGSCYNTNCHKSIGTPANRSDISNKSTLSSASLSLYSINSSSFNATFHTPDSTIPCIICHGPMHNISKPDLAQKFIKNNDTEVSHCNTCHQSYSRHNNSVNCTFCHSDDIHAIQVISQNATYITYNMSTPNPDTGACPNCHQNLTYYTTIKTNPRSGTQGGRNAPFLGTSLEHSDDLSSGSKFNSYWIPGTTRTACEYCHGPTKHLPISFGRPGNFKGNNTINSTIGNTTWCLSCHYPSYANYSEMVSSYPIVPPSIIKNTTYFISGRDHSVLDGFNDSVCYSCHNGTNNYSKMTEFMHGTYIGGGGADCLKCHDMGKNASYLHVNNTAMEQSFHANLNNLSVNSTNISAKNKKCWGCHQSDGSQPIGDSMGNKYTKPYTCDECHLINSVPYENITNPYNVTNHIWVDSPLTGIVTRNSTCSSCHNNSVNLNTANLSDNRTLSKEESVSHYGTMTNLIDSMGVRTPAQGCNYCHLNATNGIMWGNATDPRSSTAKPHTQNTNSQCYICHLSTIPSNETFHDPALIYAGDGRMIMGTNRYVILDDPVLTGAKSDTASGFYVPTRNWNTNYWLNHNTKINATALFIDRFGTPAQGRNISFTLYYPNGTASNNFNDTTNVNGLANSSFDMNAKNYYGKWKISASDGRMIVNSYFIYNWWGCSGTAGCSGHSSKSPGTASASKANSPYLSGRDSITNSQSDHRASKCTFCHQSFDGKQGGASSSNFLNYPSDVHRNISCDNVNCHGPYTSAHNSNQLIQSCFNSSCHNRSDISRKSTLSSVTVATAKSLYSASNGSTINGTFHNPNSTVPCIICHGPMHDITKTDPGTRFIKNNITENSQCQVCHEFYLRHNSSVNCTLCHSDDVHVVQVIAHNGSYVTYNKNHDDIDNNNKNNPDTGGCADCHQNASFYTAVKNNPKAGPQTGRDPPLIPNPNHHSSAYDNGSRYGSYWTLGSQSSACKYCHGDNFHEAKALGKPLLFQGNNSINGTFTGGNTTWCLVCHYPYSPNYPDMAETFATQYRDVPPSIIKGTQYYVNGRDHSIQTHNDSHCYMCHNHTGTNYTGITQFMHDIEVGGGGPDCLGCHEVGRNGSIYHVNNSLMNQSGMLHKILNQNATNSSWVSGENKKCWGCHQTGGTQPDNKSMGDRYSHPYTCYECHLNDAKPYENVNNAVNVTNHIWVNSPITRIVAHNATCVTCHNNSVFSSNAIPDQRTISQYEGVSHYGFRGGLIDSIGTEVPSQGCVYCHLNASNWPVWGYPVDPRIASAKAHTETTNNKCYACHIEGAIPSSFHNESIYFFGLGRIIVSTNRNVILDDPNSGKADTTAGYATPPHTWNSNYWSGKNTLINATALYINAQGKPLSGKTINFSIYYPNGTKLNSANATTSALGLASFSYDMNAKNYYGNWKIGASEGILHANTTFIYNWWACAASGGGCGGHGSENPGSGTPSLANSPYLSGRDRITNEEGIHHAASVNCTYCHSSFDGIPGGQTFAGRKNSGKDVHRNILCSNSSCHGSYTQHNTNQLIYSCFNTGCHSRSDISRKSTLSSATVASAISLYSYNNGDSINATYHTPNSTVPCFICHGPMHDITKSDPKYRFIKNNQTESSNCVSCHQNSVKHNTSVECTVCHSDDIHVTKVLAQNATYITLNKYDQDPARGNCTNCHQNSSFVTALISLPDAGTYTGNNTPQVPSSVNHSNDPNAGAKWNQTPGYWTNTSQLSSCIYCHGETKHTINALGSPTTWSGGNTVNSIISNNSTWCSSCHWQGYTQGDYSYSDMTSEFLSHSMVVPPEFSGNPTFGANKSNPSYINHSNIGKNDTSCKECHSQGLSANSTITNLMHDVVIGESGSSNCIACHDLETGLSGGASVGINFTAANSSVHSGINSINATSRGYVNITGACWACHDSDGNVTSGHPDRYKTPKTCTECHLGSGTYNTSAYNATIVSEHYYSGTDIGAGNSSSNISSCINCHENVTGMILYNNDTDYGSFIGDGIRQNGGNRSFYHYGKQRTDMVISNDLSDCTWCHRNSTNEFLGNFQRKGAPNYTENIAHATSLESCILPDCHNRGRIHDMNLTIPTWVWDDQPPWSWQSDRTCKDCHYKLNGSVVSQYYVNETMFNESAHGNVNCTLCHVRIANKPASLHPVAEYYWKWCECCHSYQSDPLNSSERHNITLDPYNYKLNVNGNMTSVVNITDCAFCHNAADFNRSVAQYPVNKCRYCHDFPEFGNVSKQSWY